MSSLSRYLKERAETITRMHLDPDAYRADLDAEGLTEQEAVVTRTLSIPEKRDIVREALDSLTGDEITTFGDLAKLVGSKGAQGVTSIVLSELVDPISASRVFSAPKGGLYSAADTPGGFASHFPEYQTVQKPRSKALEQTGVMFQQVGDSIVLTDPQRVTAESLATRLRYLN